MNRLIYGIITTRGSPQHLTQGLAEPTALIGLVDDRDQIRDLVTEQKARQDQAFT